MQKNNEHIDPSENGILDRIPKQNNFKIPSDYFEKFSSKIEKELHFDNKKTSNKTKKQVVITLIANLSIAAAVVLGVLIFKPSSSQNTTEKESVTVSIEDFQDSFIAMDEFDMAIFEFDENIEVEIKSLLHEYDFEEFDTYSDDIIIEFEDDFEL